MKSHRQLKQTLKYEDILYLRSYNSIVQLIIKTFIMIFHKAWTYIELIYYQTYSVQIEDRTLG